MVRGTDDYTVQDLLNYIGGKIAEIDASLPQKHTSLGYAHMRSSDDPRCYAVALHVTEIQSACAKRDELQRLSWDIERKCGELYDENPVID